MGVSLFLVGYLNSLFILDRFACVDEIEVAPHQVISLPLPGMSQAAYVERQTSGCPMPHPLLE
jgi:hypothetical protein